MVLNTLDKPLAKVSDCPKKISHKGRSQSRDVPARKNDVFDDGDTAQPELDSRIDDGNLLDVPAPVRGSMLPTSRLPTDEAVDLDVRSLRHLQKKKGLSDFLQYDVVGDGLVRVGTTDPMPDIAVITRGRSGSSVQDVDEFSPTFLPYRDELGPNQYRRAVVDGARYYGSQPLASKLSAPLPVPPDLSKDRQHVPPVLRSHCGHNRICRRQKYIRNTQVNNQFLAVKKTKRN